jgi:hypothetical protein
MPLHFLKTWAPFRIDALGLVTLLGVDELNLAIGRLARNSFTEYLPLLGGYIIANNSFVKPTPGFSVYNITDGIMATDVTGWFARWLTCQQLTWSSTTIRISGVSRRTAQVGKEFISSLIGLVTLAPVLVFTCIMGDWWGFANTLSMLISVVVRRIVVGQNRLALDKATENAVAMSVDTVKTFWTLPDGKAVTIIAPRGILIGCLLTTPRPPNPRLYNYSRILGWIGFGCHVITLGMATLFCQLLSVTLLLTATTIVAKRVGDDEYRIGSNLYIERRDSEGRDFRAAAYARLELTMKEEASMVAWNLFPHKSNEEWWNKYETCKGSEAAKGFANWDQILARKSEKKDHRGEKNNKELEKC